MKNRTHRRPQEGFILSDGAALHKTQNPPAPPEGSVQKGGVENLYTKGFGFFDACFPLMVLILPGLCV